MARREPKKCRDPQCGATAPGTRSFPLDRLPAAVRQFVEERGIPAWDVVECLYCFSVSAREHLLGHRSDLTAETMRWIVPGKGF